MSSYDDLFYEKQERPEKLDTDAWKAKKQAERSAVYEMMDSVTEKLQTDGALFQKYLDVQSRFDRYSVGNALLILAQKPEATRLGDYGYWKENDGFVKRDGKGITILEPGDEYTREDGSVGVYYNPKKVFDISQTTVRAKARTAPEDDRQLLRALIHNPPALLKSVPPEEMQGREGAVFDLAENCIYIRKGMEAGNLFRALSKELAHAEMANGDVGYDRQAHEFRALCASYLLCRKYGVDVSVYLFDRLPESFRDMEPQAFRSELAGMRDAVNAISGRMVKVLEPRKPERQQER